jgi:hypothetical protein
MEIPVLLGYSTGIASGPDGYVLAPPSHIVLAERLPDLLVETQHDGRGRARGYNSARGFEPIGIASA